ncbi:hypothetical protein ETD83_30025 [Actinomadura soli]|uniref:Guanylate cyclase domain-containing protein n=1 Tax=Actinomadura soli TaxID=2508997 RepID=A0A5C4J600_9ACTN|nr:hypothetical protein [Actinomadura soli]TMQ91617.1 hypothetical protein ETD83_30025 [Actinomadura soli]
MSSNQPVHRSILAIDIEGSTAAVRTNPIRRELRSQIYRMLAVAMDHTGIDGHWCDPFEDRGDGVLVMMRPVDELPKTLLLSRLVPQLALQLLEYNTGLPAGERRRRGLRLRTVVHAGEVHRDENGYFGEAVDHACRLLDSPKLKQCLRDSPTPLILVVSEDIYWGIVRHGYDGICPTTYNPDLRVSVGGRRRTGYVHVPSTIPDAPENRSMAVA